MKTLSQKTLISKIFFVGPQKDRLCWILSNLLGGLVRLLGEEDSLDVGEDSTLGDGDSGQQLVELLVVPDGELKVTRDDPGLLVVPGGVASELEDLRGEVLHDGSEVDGSSSTNTSGVVSLAKETMDPANGELKASAAGTGFGLGLDFSTFSSPRHVERLDV